MTSPTQKHCHSFQLIDGKGEFNKKGLHNFRTATNLSNCGVGYGVIAIIGPQSSGKSTFMNHFGGTNFKEMNSLSGRNRTTQGIWISNCVAIHRQFTIAMDIEGTDGEERGEDDTSFERQSALFALAVADTLIINLWCHDIGRQRAASITLLKTILQTRTRMDRSRKVKLCFILRDMEKKTPLKSLEEKIKITMDKIWTTITRTNGFKGTNISDFFHVLVFGLPHYEFEKKNFKDQVAELRGKILPVDREGFLPAVAFQENAQRLWKSIKEEPFLNLPAHSDMIAEHMCKEIANTCLKSLTSSKGLMELKKEVEAWPVKNFGDKLRRLMETTLSKYLSEVQHFKRRIRKKREKVLKSEILKILHPLYVTMLGHVRNQTFQEFKMRLTTRMRMKGVTFVVANRESYNICKPKLEEQCKDVVGRLSAGWDWSGCNKKLCNEMKNYASSIRSTGTSKLKEKYQDQVADYITKSLESELQNCTEDTYWKSINKVVKMSTSDALISNFSSAVATYWEDISLSNKMIQELQTYARNLVVKKLRAEIDKIVVDHMTNRFGSVLCRDKDLTKAIGHASAAAIKLLSVMAVVQFDGKSNNCIDGVLLSSLMNANSSTTCHLDINKWKGVSEDDTIIAPWKFKSLWSQFNDTTKDIVEEVLSNTKKIQKVKRTEKSMQVMSVVSAVAGAVLAALAGLLAATLGDFTFTLGAVPVMTLFKKLVKYFEKKKLKARQYAIDLQKRHLQRCHKRFHGGQSSLQ